MIFLQLFLVSWQFLPLCQFSFSFFQVQVWEACSTGLAEHLAKQKAFCCCLSSCQHCGKQKTKHQFTQASHPACCPGMFKSDVAKCCLTCISSNQKIFQNQFQWLPEENEWPSSTKHSCALCAAAMHLEKKMTC